MRGHPIHSLSLLACSAFLLASTAERASAREDMSGEWIEDHSETVYSVEEWNAACGSVPRSTGQQRRKLVYTVKDRGVELVFSGRSGSFSTVDCQSDNPEVKPRERTVKDALFLISCATAEDSTRYENGLYSFRIQSPSRIEYRETTRFSRNVSGALCVYTRRVRRLYLRRAAKAPDAGEVSAGAELDASARGRDAGAGPGDAGRAMPDAGQAEPRSPKPAGEGDPCARPGPVSSLMIEPAHTRARPGERICPRASAVDEKGCPVEPQLAQVGRVAGLELQTDGCVRVSAKARPGTHRLRLRAGRAEAELEIEVERAGKAPPPVRPRPDAVPDEPVGAGPGPDGEPSDAAADARAEEPAGEPVQAGPDAGTAAARAAPALPGGLPAWVWIALGAVLLVLLLGMGLLLALRRRAASRPAVEVPSSAVAPRPYRPAGPTRVEPLRGIAAASGPPDSATLDSVEGESPAADTGEEQGEFCTQCGQRMPPDSVFCPFCRAPVGEAPPPPAAPAAPVCPGCGQSVPAEASFCPFCRHRLH
ncbi:MAG: zinc ribbon domain-containing protein [Deltaproteobacteria bacterium]|nr:zinc ribbon domain-containing protein [Deltaproteobacteria bacterium]